MIISHVKSTYCSQYHAQLLLDRKFISIRMSATLSSVCERPFVELSSSTTWLYRHVYGTRLRIISRCMSIMSIQRHHVDWLRNVLHVMKEMPYGGFLFFGSCFSLFFFTTRLEYLSSWTRVFILKEFLELHNMLSFPFRRPLSAAFKAENHTSVVTW